ncbi:MAG: LysM domain-containing protein, partial [Verrucomicrobiota bacterium]
TPLPATTVQTQRPRTHLVKSGETMTAIAAKYGLRMNLFMAANPGVKPTKLRPGQTLNIPPR